MERRQVIHGALRKDNAGLNEGKRSCQRNEVPEWLHILCGVRPRSVFLHARENSLNCCKGTFTVK